MRFLSRNRCIICLLSTAILMSCSSSVKMAKPEGDQAQIRLKAGGQFRGELLAVVKNEAVIFLCSQKVYKIYFDKISKIIVEGYTLLHKKGLILMPLSFIDLSLIFSNQYNALRYVGGVLAALKYNCIVGGDPPIVFAPPIYWRELDNLKLYCRYPRDLEPKQWESLLRFHGQDAFLSGL